MIAFGLVQAGIVGLAMASIVWAFRQHERDERAQRTNRPWMASSWLVPGSARIPPKPNRPPRHAAPDAEAA